MCPRARPQPAGDHDLGVRAVPKPSLADPLPAHRFFFPAAAAYAAAAVPLSLSSMRGEFPAVPGLSTALHHGHEMLFGFALAVVTGFLLPRLARGRLYVMAGLWLGGRAAYLLDPFGPVSMVIDTAFAVTLAAEAAPRFIRAAKKWRNQVFGPMLVVLALAVAAFHLASLEGTWHWRRDLLQQAVLVFGLLMFFMGGRTIAPAAAGHLQKIGIELAARVQPGVEGTVLILLIAALVLLPFDPVRPVAGIAMIVAGLATGLRLLRWRLWRCRGQPDLIGFGIGYGWLAVGLVLMGAALWSEAYRFADAMHALTVGALGTLTVSVMARTRLLNARQDPAGAKGIPAAVGLIAVAALIRTTASTWSVDPWQAYWLAALCWSLAYLLLIRLLRRT